MVPVIHLNMLLKEFSRISQVSLFTSASRMGKSKNQCTKVVAFSEWYSIYDPL